MVSKLETTRHKFQGSYEEYWCSDPDTWYEIVIVTHEAVCKFRHELEIAGELTHESLTKAMIDLYFPDPITCGGMIWRRIFRPPFKDEYYAVRQLRVGEIIGVENEGRIITLN